MPLPGLGIPGAGAGGGGLSLSDQTAQTAQSGGSGTRGIVFNEAGNNSTLTIALVAGGALIIGLLIGRMT